ncbi:glycosyltransferase family 4 protein [Microbacterium sp. F2]|uniref:glycosyltransferase family 4 protein n=1 Tax=Microbacterium sp. F2 TaxID=3422228 RepID=UPI003FD0AB74
MEASLTALSAHLVSIGYKLALVTTSGGDPARLDIFEEVWELPGGREGRYSFSWWVRTASKGPWVDWDPHLVVSISVAGAGVARRLRGRAPSAAQSHGAALEEVRSSLRTATLRELSKIPLNAVRILRDRVAYRQFDRVWAVGDGVASQLTHPAISVPASKLKVVHNGVEPSAFSFSHGERVKARNAAQIAPTATVVVTTSRLHRQKGVALLLEALRQPACISMHALIVGTGPDESRLRTLAADRTLAGRVHFVGAVPRDDLGNLLSAADVFALPSLRSEGAPLSILEAASAGLRIVCTAGTPIPEALGGVVHFASATPAALATALASVAARAQDEGRFSRLPKELTQEKSLADYSLDVAALITSE